MKHKLNQKGFGTIEAVIILVVIAVLGVGSYYVWHKNHQMSNPTNTASSTSNSNNSSNAASKTVVATTLGSTPSGLQVTVASKLKSAGCLLPNGNVASGVGDTTGASLSSLQVYYVKDSAAKINTCGGTEYYTYTKAWSYATGGQSDLSCSTYLEYEIPAALVAAGTGSSTAHCVNSNGTTLDTYMTN